MIKKCELVDWETAKIRTYEVLTKTFCGLMVLVLFVVVPFVALYGIGFVAHFSDWYSNDAPPVSIIYLGLFTFYTTNLGILTITLKRILCK